MSNPYVQLLQAVVDRVRKSDFITNPPAILVVPEEDEPSDDRPGQGDSIADRVEFALERAGIAVIVYIENGDATSEGGDKIDLRVQVAERPINNRHQSGTQKPCWEVLFSVRAQLENWAPEPEGSWAPFLFLGFTTITKGNDLVREVQFQTLGFLTAD